MYPSRWKEASSLGVRPSGRGESGALVGVKVDEGEGEMREGAIACCGAENDCTDRASNAMQ